MEFESAIATADDLESTGEVEPLATWEHEDLAQVQFQYWSIALVVGTSCRTKI